MHDPFVIFLTCISAIIFMGAMWIAGKQAVQPALTGLAKVIYVFNRQQAAFAVEPTFTESAKGVTLTEDDEAQAQELADVLDATVPPADPMSIPLALLGSESDLSVKCLNGNFLGSNKDKSALGYDDGPAQEKLKYLIGQPGVTDAASAEAFAMDPKRAIPYFWGLYQAHLVTAQNWLDAGAPSDIDPRLTNKWILASLIYKQGETGAYTLFKAGTWPAELNNFVSLEGYFSKQLNQKSVFAGLV